MAAVTLTTGSLAASNVPTDFLQLCFLPRFYLWSPSVLFLFLASARSEDALKWEGPLSFVDDFAVEQMTGLDRTLEQPVKKQKPVIVGEKPWESNPYLFGTVLFDSSTATYRMWYMSYNRGKTPTERTPILYAESKDGLT